MSDLQDDRRSPDALLARAVCDSFWVPEDVHVVDRPDLCMLSCPRDLPGLNTVLRSRGPGRHMPTLVEEVRAAHAGRRSRWMVGPLDGGEALEDVIEAAGYRPGHNHYGYSTRTDRTLTAPQEDIVVRPVEDMQGMRDWAAVAAQAFGEPTHHDEAELSLYLRQCSGPGARVVRVVAHDLGSDEPISAGGLTLFPSLGFGLLWSGGTIPAARGRGAYRMVLEARVDEACRRGLARVGLYAREGTTAPIVSHFGFERHGPMRFWLHPA